ncbi:alpha/beta fold hydrolase [Aquipuribacter sp. SD81]|uniref:alpha/beta fold hydrolase n=1 Tax=Aquipuribacter sp. SD81 TaxID=3127703 RepID=UPI003016D3FC
MRRSLRAALAYVTAAAVTLTAGAAASAPASASPPRPAAAKPTVVLVHGAFADASSWTPVTDRLLAAGYPVLAPTNPLRGVTTDVQYLREVLASVSGPIVLVGHSYGGFVMTNAAAGDADVEALVYVAAFAPEIGETAGGISQSAGTSLLTPDRLDIHPYTGADGATHYEATIKVEHYREVFAADVPPRTAASLAVSQKPADVSTLFAPSGEPAWRDVPTWTLVATQDNVIPPEAQRAMASRAGATTVEVKASHSVALSSPAKVAALVIDAARTVQVSP